MYYMDMKQSFALIVAVVVGSIFAIWLAQTAGMEVIAFCLLCL